MVGTTQDKHLHHREKEDDMKTQETFHNMVFQTGHSGQSFKFSPTRLWEFILDKVIGVHRDELKNTQSLV